MDSAYTELRIFPQTGQGLFFLEGFRPYSMLETSTTEVTPLSTSAFGSSGKKKRNFYVKVRFILRTMAMQQ